MLMNLDVYGNSVGTFSASLNRRYLKSIGRKIQRCHWRGTLSLSVQAEKKTVKCACPLMVVESR
jgi:hypothetical protein